MPTMLACLPLCLSMLAGGEFRLDSIWTGRALVEARARVPVSKSLDDGRYASTGEMATAGHVEQGSLATC